MTNTENAAPYTLEITQVASADQEVVVRVRPVAGTQLYDLVEKEVGGALAYVSTGADPQMILSLNRPGFAGGPNS